MSHRARYITTFILPIHITADDVARRTTMRALNKYYTGKEEIPLNEEIPAALKDAAYRVCRTTMQCILVGVTFDGSLEVIND